MQDCSTTKSSDLSGGIGRTGLGGRALDAEYLMERALQRTKRQNFSDLSFVEPLKRLLRSCNEEADLSAFGRYATHFDIMRCLNNLLLFDISEERDPGILSRPIGGPVFITGLPRSATSFLHLLLAQDTANRIPRCWELIYPYPARTTLFHWDLRRLRVGLQLRFFRWLSPGLGDLHPLTADAPQECTDITAQVFQSLRFENTHRIPSYQEWLDAHGHYNAFRFHRRFLQHLQAQSSGKRWILKSPDHIFALDAIRTTYPDARIVFLHRDPLSVVASCCKLSELLRRPFTRHTDRSEIGRQVSSRLLESSDHMISAANRHPNILNLHYEHVVADPIGAVKNLYSHFGIALYAESERRMRCWLTAQRRRASPHYDLSEFGLDSSHLRKCFTRYVDTFGVSTDCSNARMRVA